MYAPRRKMYRFFSFYSRFSRSRGSNKVEEVDFSHVTQHGNHAKMRKVRKSEAECPDWDIRRLEKNVINKEMPVRHLVTHKP